MSTRNQTLLGKKTLSVADSSVLLVVSHPPQAVSVCGFWLLSMGG